MEMDHDLHMVKEPTRDFKSMNHLLELRYRAEHDPLRPRVSSTPRGPLLFRLSDPEIKKWAMIQADVEWKPKIGLAKATALMEHIAQHGDY